MAGQEHLGDCYTRVALQRDVQGRRYLGTFVTYGEAYEMVFASWWENSDDGRGDDWRPANAGEGRRHRWRDGRHVFTRGAGTLGAPRQPHASDLHGSPEPP